jgi:SAM-dependent methyltransferase
MSKELETLYANRFDDADRAWKTVVWGILWRRVFARWVPAEATVLDLGAGYCEFINRAVARRRIAVDLNPDTVRRAEPGVELRCVSADQLDFLADGEVDVVFSSNFLEHLPSKAAVSAVIAEAMRVLKPGGRIILMGPNIRYLADQYWDYFDHHVPLSHASICEGLSLHGLRVDHVEARFLPYTVKGSRARWPFLVEAYLALRPWSSAILGKQFLVSAVKEG